MTYKVWLQCWNLSLRAKKKKKKMMWEIAEFPTIYVFKSLFCQGPLNRKVVWKRINRHLEKWVKMKSQSCEKPTR